MKKILSILTLVLLMIVNLTACAFGKKDAESSANVPNMNYEGNYEFPDVVSVAHCINCDEDYKHYGWDYEEEIKMSDLSNKAYTMVCFDKDGYEYSYPMKINDKEMEFVYVDMSNVPKSIKDTVYSDCKLVYGYEDDEVVISIIRSKNSSLCEGKIYDKTKTFTDINGEECVCVNIKDYEKDVTTEDLITALNSFEYSIIEKDDAETHLHILPKVK